MVNDAGGEKQSWTRLQLIEWTASFFGQKGIDSARLDAEVLLAHALATTRLNLYVHYDEPVDAEVLSRYRELVSRRARREPLKYILGRTEFLSLPLVVDRRVLIPRPETELLAERAIELLRRELPPGPKTVVDVGTGSGAIAVAVAKNMPDVVVHATDTSADALELAEKNARELGVQGQVVFQHGDLFEPVCELAGQVHLVTSNPPYVAESDFAGLAPELRYEPRQAVVSGATGLEVIEKLVRAAPDMLMPLGVLLCEIGADQAPEVKRLAEGTEAYSSVTLRQDYANIERILEARKGPPASPGSVGAGGRPSD